MTPWLITGGCGFLGSNLAAKLIDTGTDVVVVDTLVRAGSDKNLAWLRTKAETKGAGKLTHLAADTRSQTDIDEVFLRHGKGLAAIAHLAGQVAMTTSIARPRYDFEVNVLGALNVLEAARRTCPETPLFFSSTNKVYGDLEGVRHVETATRWTCPDYPNGFDESVRLDFQSPYGCSKGAADQYFLDYHRMYGLKTVVFRHSSIYGGRQFATFDQGWVGWFCQQALAQKAERDAGRIPAPFTISGDGKQVRDLLFADDIVRCYLAAFEQVSACAGRAFNIGGGMVNSLSLLELFALLERELGVELRYEKLAARASDQRVFVADNGAMMAATGWSPTVSSAEGVRRMVEWAKSQDSRARSA